MFKRLFSEELEVKVGVNQGLVCPLLLFIVVEALLREFRAGCPWERLKAFERLTKKTV